MQILNNFIGRFEQNSGAKMPYAIKCHARVFNGDFILQQGMYSAYSKPRQQGS